MTMTSKARVMAALQLKEPDRVPFMDWIEPGIRAQCEKAVGKGPLDEAQFAREIGFDAIGYNDFHVWNPIFDETVEDADGHVHYLARGKLKTLEDVEKAQFPDLSDDSIFDAAKRFVDQYGDSDLALHAGVRPGVMNTIYSLGWQGFSEALVDQPRTVERLTERFIDWNITAVEKLQPLGFDFIGTYDDIAYKSGPMFSPQVYREIFMPHLRRLAEALYLPWTYHSDGDLTMVMEDLLSLGLNALNPIEPGPMDLKRMKETYGHRVCLWGNIDLVYTLTRGTPEEVEAEVAQRIREAGPGGGYILASANSITEYCKVENVLAMGRAVKKHGRYPLAV